MTDACHPIVLNCSVFSRAVYCVQVTCYIVSTLPFLLLYSYVVKTIGGFVEYFVLHEVFCISYSIPKVHLVCRIKCSMSYQIQVYCRL